MIWIANPAENICIASMGKKLRVRAVADNDTAANDYCARTADVGVIACLGPLVFIADLYSELSRLRAVNTKLLAALKAARNEIHNPGTYLHATAGGNIDDLLAVAIAKAEQARS